MTYLVPREKICETVLLGFARPSHGPFHIKSKQCDPSIKPRPYDREKGLALLKEAGYTFNERKKLLIDKNGAPFTFALTYPSGSAVWDTFIPILRDNYQHAGIQCELRPLDWAVFSQRLKDRDYEAISLGWTGGIETDIYQMFHSSQIADKGDNFIQYRNPTLDSLIEKARACVDENLRMPLWRKCHRIIYDDQPYTFLWTRESSIFIKKRIHNVERLEMGLNDSIEWYVPASERRWTR